MLPPLILVVDDDHSILAFLTSALQDEGYDVVLSVGAAALEVARTRHPAAILLDVMMPGMDGLEVSRRLHADPATAAIPIILMSAGVRPQVMSALPVNDCLSKPFSLDDLYAVVARWAV